MRESQKKVFVIDGLRTPFTKAGKEFDNLHPNILATHNLKEFLYKMNFTGNEIEEVILGNGFTLPDSFNIARVAVLQAGMPKEVSATTTLRNCASSMESFVTGMAKIQAGLYNSVIVGGVESMSHIPFLFNRNFSKIIQHIMLSKSFKQKLKSIQSLKLSYLKPIISLLEGLKDPITGYSMGDTAELLAKEFNISRKDQDEFAFLSHKKACNSEQKLAEEIFPFFTDHQVVNKDMGPRAMSEQRLSRMKPFFDKRYGTVTIANSCPINDGSSLLLLMSEERMKNLDLKPLAVVRSTAFTGLEPKRMGLGPVYSSSIALKKAGLNLKNIDLIEINEAFAAQVLACLQAFASKTFCESQLNTNQALGEIDPKKLNVNGGAIAIGHPISATGTRIILTLAKEMKRRNSQFGLATLCIGGGQGGAVILENAS